jgi:hypothetical protein
MLNTSIVNAYILSKHCTTLKNESVVPIELSKTLLLMACFYYTKLVSKRFILLKTHYYQPLSLTILIHYIRRIIRNIHRNASSAGGSIASIEI